MNRWLALLLAAVGGGTLAFAAILGAVAALGGLLWIYVFGDNPWPAWAMTALNILIPLCGLALWVVFAWVIWRRLRPRG